MDKEAAKTKTKPSLIFNQQQQQQYQHQHQQYKKTKSLSSKSLLQSSDSISDDCVAITTSQRLSSYPQHQKTRSWFFLINPFNSTCNFKQQKEDGNNYIITNAQVHDDMKKRGQENDDDEEEEEEEVATKEKSRWSSWLPDPNRRWPVQGW